MAERNKPSHAERAASAAKSKTKRKNTATQKNRKMPAEEAKAPSVPARVISSILFLCLFVVMLILFFRPEGAVMEILYNVIHGLIGRAGYIIAIPVLLYLFCIHAFSGERPVSMRTACLFSFILACGCITHLSLNADIQSSGFALISDLYTGGIDGITGGLFGGGIAMLIEWLCGSIISYIVLIIIALLTLLGGMQITIPSIVRAVQNRPRADWEDQERPERREPAAVVIDHFTNRHIANRERQHREREERQLSFDDMRMSNANDPRKKDRVNARELVGQIDGDVSRPVAAAAAEVASTTSISVDPDLDTPDIPAPKPAPEAVRETPRTQEPDLTGDLPQKYVEDVKKERVTAQDAEASALEVAIEIAQAESEEKPEYTFPPVELLELPKDGHTDGTAEMRNNTELLTETLDSFHIEAHIINVTRGPSVTRYEVELEKGVRLSKLTTAANDIALSLGADGVRIEAIPGKNSVVGIEVPNKAVTTVSLREVIDSKEFKKAKSKSSFAVGKDIGGTCIVGNIAKLPHMLIAGTTGSGKSVCMNSVIISILYKASPDDVKLIMVDPKMVELGIYNGIPHLKIPVVTDPKKAAGALQWAVTEMMRRYRAMSDAGVRDLESYNTIVSEQEMDAVKLPQLVVIIDELADLMLVAAKEVEESICRIAQMGRAAGIHLIIATQRPSADVITGLMKANIPSRIAFSVASSMESRIILDTVGAEKLVGKGDMLYAPIGNGKPLRVQGCFVTDSEVEAVTSFVKNNSLSDYDQEVLEEIERKAAQTDRNNKTAASDPAPSGDETAGDEMLPAAVDVILEIGQASVSMLQRRLKLGYARAARIVDEMEELGIVGPYAGSKPREILITKEQWENMRNGQPAQLGFDDLESESQNASVPDELD